MATRKKLNTVKYTPVESILNFKNLKWQSTYFELLTTQKVLQAIEDASDFALPQRANLIELYKKIEFDGYIQSMYAQRSNAILQSEYKLLKDEKEYESKIDLEKWIEILFQTLLYGYSFVQVLKSKKDYCKFKVIERKFCQADYNTIDNNPYIIGEGEIDVNDYEEILILKIDNLGEYSKLLEKYVHYNALQYEWSTYIEKYATPFLVVKSNMLDDEAKSQLANVLSNLGGNTSLMLSSEDEFEAIMASEDGQVYVNRMKDIKDEIAIIILGQTLTSTSQTGGTEQLGKIHNNILTSIIESDKKFIINQMNELVIPFLIDLGIIDEGVEFDIIETTSSLNSALIEDILKLSQAGYEVSEEELSEKLGIRITKKQITGGF